MRRYLCGTALAVFMTATPSHAFQGREVGNWYVGFFSTNTCMASTLHGSTFLMITYDGGIGTTSVRVKSEEFFDYPEFSDSRGMVSFSPNLVRYWGKSRLYRADDEQAATFRIEVDNSTILSDLSRQKFIRVSDMDGLLAKQVPLSGSSDAIRMMKFCIEETMAGR